MRTDHPIYTLLSTGAEAFRVLTGGLRLVGPYRFRSVGFKALERRADGVFEPEGLPEPSHQPSYLVEFQAQRAPGAWYNLLTKVGLLGEQRPKADVRGILIFLHEQDDPGLPFGIAAADPPFAAVYLNRFLPALLKQEPDNPFVAVLAPLVIERDNELKALAPKLWQTIQVAPLPAPIRDRLAEVLQFWLFERFKSLTAEEILAMITHLTPLEETRAYRDIFSRGEAKGKREGEAEAKAKTLLRQLRRRFGAVPEWAEQRIAAASTEQLDAWLDGIFDADGITALIGPADPPGSPRT
jgi:predicted transposase YdaD